ncbi:MAG: hypothetical protein M4579_006238 [Chaenotheca gracillima]|nr:MAG: hypothetical protein M4579_006238 [Chaenotheca gracillima]
MAAIQIPSPSAFLDSPMLKQSVGPAAPRNSTPRPSVHKRTSSEETLKADPSTKPKQSKSRNGCITCKAKRLKCDETKPSCQQCQKRNVNCGGYKKDFKWRQFEESSFCHKAAPAKRRPSPPVTTNAPLPKHSSPPLEGSTSSDSISDASFPCSTPNAPTFNQSFLNIPQSSQFMHMQPDQSFSRDPLPSYDPYSFETSKLMLNFDGSFPHSSGRFDNSYDGDAPLFHTGALHESSASGMSGQSPSLIDLLLPGTDIHNPSRHHDGPVREQDAMMPTPSQSMDQSEDDMERVHQQPNSNAEAWIMRLPSPSLSDSSTSSTSSNHDAMSMIYRQPNFPVNSPESLMMRFDKQTCGILSIKDGPTENPWRTLIWPLIHESPALYHALASLTAFHTSKQNPSLRIQGMDHMREGIMILRSCLNEMSTETALATTLVLAFSESWDVHISTGMQHLRGAKILIDQALERRGSEQTSPEDTARLRFLINTWVYMDVIARLTSVDHDESADFYHVVASPTFGDSAEVDPLMGCASSLFPLIGRVANLVRRVRKSATNSPAVISQATELKTQIEEWEIGTFFETPEDPTSEVKHSIQTAEAYRWATLLYLHQAVPEVPSLSAAQLAKKVLQYLATVPLSSRTIIIHIYPLLAAGCEVVGQEDRQWVGERWASMINRMWIGNIDRCWEVIKEVWERRDHYDRVWEMDASLCGGQGAPYQSSPEMDMMNDCSSLLKRKFGTDCAESYPWSQESFDGSKRRAVGCDMSGLHGSHMSHGQHTRKSSNENITEDLDYEMTVRGRLHWLGVMKDWRWEVLLG